MASGGLQMNRHHRNVRRNAVIRAGVALAAFVSLAAGADLGAQTAAPQEPRFEVMSIKRNTGGGAGSMMAVQPGGRVSVRNLPVQQVILRAYGIQPFQLAGGSDWLQTERYDIEAKPSDGAIVTDDAINAMLRAMLADRFKLKMRRETRQSAIYELMFARSDRRFGEKLRQTSADCVVQRNRGTESGGSLPDAARVRGEDPIPCGMVMTGGNRIAAGGETMTRFATMLAPRVQRIVVDNTGLTGLYDFDLQFLPDQGYGRASADGPIRMYLVTADVPPLLTAIQEQLGLKLQPARGAVEYVVIESIERPSED
jgi:uncharacterized protein (TIGR03435 family)